MDHYLYLSSSDSTAVHPSNTPVDFTVELPRSIHLQGYWECALVDVQLTGVTIPFDPFCLCSDICTDSCVGHLRLPVLRRLSSKGWKKDSVLQFEQTQYKRVKLNQISRIRLFIRSIRHSPPSVTTGELTCTLHIRHERGSLEETLR